jgi:hypothetical protein
MPASTGRIETPASPAKIRRLERPRNTSECCVFDRNGYKANRNLIFGFKIDNDGDHGADRDHAHYDEEMSGNTNPAWRSPFDIHNFAN